MEIGVDIRVLNLGFHSGIQEYTSNLLSHLITNNPHIKYKLFLNNFKKIKLNYNWLNKPNVKLYQFEIPNKLFFPLSKYFNQPRVDELIGGVDVFFSPHFYTPTSSQCKKVITFHDLSFIRHPEFFSRRQNFWHSFQINSLKQAESADKIIAVSESTKYDVVDLLGINSDKISVIYSGLNEVFTKKVSDEDFKKVKGKYNLPENYILYFGTLEPRKNIVGIIKAFNIIQKKELRDFNLVLAGSEGWLSKEIFKAINSSPFRSKIKYIGSVLKKDRIVIYKGAKLFVYPSFFEGFGFPPLEAMASGIPVVTSNSSSLPEVVGDSAIIVNPHNISEIADAIFNILSDQNLYNFYISKGLEKSKKFSWDKTAEQTLDILLS